MACLNPSDPSPLFRDRNQESCPLAQALAVISTAAVFGPSDSSDPNWAAQVSEASSVLASQNWGLLDCFSGLKLPGIRCPDKVLDYYGLNPSTLDEDDWELLTLVLAAEGVVLGPLPPLTTCRVLDGMFGIAGPMLQQGPSSFFGLVSGFVLKLFRLSLPRGREVQRSAHRWLEVLIEGPEFDRPLAVLVKSLEVCRDQHLDLFAQEAAAFLLAAPDLIGGASISGRGGPVAPCPDRVTCVKVVDILLIAKVRRETCSLGFTSVLNVLSSPSPRS